MKKENKLDPIGRSWLSLCIAISFMFCVFAPLDTFLTNQSEFWFHLLQLLPVLLISFAAMAGILYGLCLLAKRTKIALYIYGFFFSILVFFYIQGNYIPRNYGVLNGVEIQWSDYPEYAVASRILFIITIALWLILCLKVKEKIYIVGRYFSVILILIQLVTMVTLYVQNNVLADQDTFSNRIVTEKEMFHLSKNKNILVFVLDTFDSDNMKHLLESENAEKYKELFADFTYYPNTLGAYPTTKGAMPYLLTGEWYENEKPYTQYVEEAYMDNKIYQALKENKYSIGVYTSLLFLSSDSDLYLNVEEGSYKIANYASFLKKIYQLVAFNYMPHSFKKYFFIYTDDFSDLKKSSTKNEAFSSDVQTFDRQIEEQGFSLTEEGNCFRVYHLDGVHPPHTFDEELLSDEKETYDVYDEAAGNCTLLSHFFKELKENDIYENSTIIVMADHGNIGYSQNPLFLIKNVEEQHDFQISEEKMSYEYFADLLISLAQNKRIDENYISACQLDGKRRRFLYYSWDDSWSKQYLPSMLEMWADENVRDLIVTERYYLSENSDYSYELGNQLSFMEDATAKDYCVYGFSRNEGSGTWTDGNSAQMRFDIIGDFDNLRIKLEYGRTYALGQRVIVSANERKVAEFIAAGKEEKEIIIPGEYLDNGNLVLQLELPGAVSPESRGESNDGRKLAIWMEGITITATEESFDLLNQMIDSYTLGTELSFAKDPATANNFCLSGFSGNEEGFTWTDGTTAKMKFHFHEEFENLLLKLNYNTYLSPERVIIYANDILVEDYLANGTEEKEVMIPSESIKEDELIITFEFPDAASPKSRGESKDARLLGLAFKTVTISKID